MISEKLKEHLQRNKIQLIDAANEFAGSVFGIIVSVEHEGAFKNKTEDEKYSELNKLILKEFGREVDVASPDLSLKECAAYIQKNLGRFVAILDELEC